MSARGRLLIVEDDPDQRMMLRTALADSSMEIVDVSSPAEALQLDDLSFDVIWLDMMLPGMYGWDLADQLIERGAKGIFLGTSASHACVEHARREGPFREVFLKPYPDLLAIVAAIVPSTPIAA